MATNEEPAQPPVWCADRRVLLAGLGGIGAATVLSACGGDATAHAPASTTGTTSTGTTSTGTTSTSTTSTTSSTAAAPAPPADALADTAQVPVGGGIVTNGLLIVQPVSGSFKAYDAACPHKGIIVGAPKNGVSTCPAHASTFSITDGSRLSGPTPTGLKEVQITVDGTKILRSS